MDGYIGIRRLLLDENVPKNKVENLPETFLAEMKCQKMYPT
jgi:hypothetical protein